MLNAATKRYIGFFSGLKKLAAMPSRILTVAATDGYANNNPLGNITEKFDEEAQEWKALIVAGAYELNSFHNFDQVINPNFGTLDNPHLIFTSDLPYRLLQCTGPPNEEEYDGHESLWMLLREGPLQRCMGCGQVFKLVRLRDEQNTQNEYYRYDFVENDLQDMGDADHWISYHPIRFMMTNSYEHTHFETPSDSAYLLMNEDEHDRLVVDPAYRLEQLKIASGKYQVLNEVDSLLIHAASLQPEKAPFEYSKDNYENLVQAEMAILRLRTHFKAVQRFNIRSLLDPANHERREKRMEEGALKRIHQSNTIYMNEHSEEELQYRDYYESDDEALSYLDMNLYQAQRAVLSNPKYQLKNFVFLEQYSQNRTLDSTSYIDKKIFRFNYRQSQYNFEDFERKEKRMLERMMQSGFHEKLNSFSRGNLEDLKNVENVTSDKMPLFELAVQQAIENYKNFFESDLEEDFDYVESLPFVEKRALATTLDTSKLLLPSPDEIMAISFARGDEPEEGVIRNIMDEFLSNMNTLQPIRNLTGVNRNEDALIEALKEAAQRPAQEKAAPQTPDNPTK